MKNKMNSKGLWLMLIENQDHRLTESSSKKKKKKKINK